MRKITEAIDAVHNLKQAQGQVDAFNFGEQYSGISQDIPEKDIDKELRNAQKTVRITFGPFAWIVEKFI